MVLYNNLRLPYTFFFLNQLGFRKVTETVLLEEDSLLEDVTNAIGQFAL